MTYRNYIIEKDNYGWQFHHVDYDGPEDTRIGTGSSYIDARCQVDEMIEALETGEKKAFKEMEAWSGGIAGNH